MAGAYVWRGRTTGKRYEYDRSAIPPVLIDAQGNLLDGVTFNGETLVIANADGSVARPTKTGPPSGAATRPAANGANDIYSAYVYFPAWDQHLT